MKRFFFQRKGEYYKNEVYEFNDIDEFMALQIMAHWVDDNYTISFKPNVKLGASTLQPASFDPDTYLGDKTIGPGERMNKLNSEHFDLPYMQVFVTMKGRTDDEPLRLVGRIGCGRMHQLNVQLNEAKKLLRSNTVYAQELILDLFIFDTITLSKELSNFSIPHVSDIFA